MEWLKKVLCSIWFYVALIVASLIAPFVINELFKYGETNGVVYQTFWGAEDVLSFLGSYLSFFGTIVLGAVAVFQTDRANKLAEKANNQTDIANDLARDALAQAEKANDLAYQMQRFEQARFLSMVSLTDVVYEEVFSGGIKSHRTLDKTPISEYIVVTVENITPNKYFILDLDLTNTSDYPIVQMNIRPDTCDGKECVCYNIENVVEKAVYIPARGKAGVSVSIPCDELKKSNITDMVLNIDFVNIFDYTTKTSLHLYNMGIEMRRFHYTYRLDKLSNIDLYESK